MNFFLLTAFYYQFDAAVLAPHIHPPPHHGNNFHGREADVLESTTNFWKEEAQKKLLNQLHKQTNENIAKNVILFLGDGMSLPTITAARIYSGQKTGSTGEESALSFEDFPGIGLSKVSFHVDFP